MLIREWQQEEQFLKQIYPHVSFSFLTSLQFRQYVKYVLYLCCFLSCLLGTTAPLATAVTGEAQLKRLWKRNETFIPEQLRCRSSKDRPTMR